MGKNLGIPSEPKSMTTFNGNRKANIIDTCEIKVAITDIGVENGAPKTKVFVSLTSHRKVENVELPNFLPIKFKSYFSYIH